MSLRDQLYQMLHGQERAWADNEYDLIRNEKERKRLLARREEIEKGKNDILEWIAEVEQTEKGTI